MGITKDGSVFRIALGSEAGGFETRISFAVNCHEDMKRPRIEMSQNEFVRLFREMLPHLKGEMLVGSDPRISYESQERLVEELSRIMHELAMMSLAGQISGCAVSKK